MALHVSKARGRRLLSKGVKTKEVIGLTMRSKVHVGFADSGAIVTQLSRAKPAPGADPPQIKI